MLFIIGAIAICGFAFGGFLILESAGLAQPNDEATKMLAFGVTIMLVCGVVIGGVAEKVL